jgi:hypothetical protein
MKIIEYIDDFNEKDVYVLKRIYENKCCYVRFNHRKENNVLYFTNIENNSIIYQIIPVYNLEYQYSYTSDDYIYTFYCVSSNFSYKICLSNGYLIKEKSKYRQIIAQMNINLPKELIEYIQTFI